MTFDDFLHAVCPEFDLEWRKYRRRSARHLVAGRMRELGIASFQEYRDRLLEDPLEAFAFPDLMRVTVTRFFRERPCWEELAASLPSLFTGAPPVLRAWSAGCCGGEEPYSLAILWLDRIVPFSPGASIEIIATDIDDASLARAAAGYSAGSLREAGPELLAKWFERQGELYRPRPEVRRLVRFEEGNLIADPPPCNIDLLLCRYLPFTYYRGRRLAAAVEILAAALRPGGILMIGRKEKLPPEAMEIFQPVGKTMALWRRI